MPYHQVGAQIHQPTILQRNAIPRLSTSAWMFTGRHKIKEVTVR